MNQQLKTILLTILTLSIFVIALIELSGVSSTALFNKYGISIGNDHGHDHKNDELSTEQQENKGPLTQIKFDEPKHNFGTLKEGAIVKHSFTFTNVGDQPLIITDANASCGCTVPSFSKQPIPPGGKGEVTVEFNSDGREGHQQKNVLIQYNGPDSPTSIGFEAQVEKQ